MEVHHHGSHGEAKGWKSYAKEFFMLFLAVLCGFLAEWRFENMIENHREHEYMVSMVEDLKQDTAQADSLATIHGKSIERIDTLLNELVKEDIAQNGKKVYTLWAKTMGFPDFVQNDRTIQQLKSSGSLRLIRQKNVADQIMQYDQSVRLLEIAQQNSNNIVQNRQNFTQFFDFNAIHNKSDFVPIINSSKEKISEVYADRMFWKFQLKSLQNKLLTISKKAKETSSLIEKHYH